MPNFQNQLVLAISADENNPITFSKPAPEASPVLTLGKYSKGQVWTRKDHVFEATLALIKKWSGVENGNPCAVSETDYVKEIFAGNSHIACLYNIMIAS